MQLCTREAARRFADMITVCHKQILQIDGCQRLLPAALDQCQGQADLSG